jgi:hypothetical protein
MGEDSPDPQIGQVRATTAVASVRSARVSVGNGIFCDIKRAPFGR